jgi:hypothetical protein
VAEAGPYLLTLQSQGFVGGEGVQPGGCRAAGTAEEESVGVLPVLGAGIVGHEQCVEAGLGLVAAVDALRRRAPWGHWGLLCGAWASTGCPPRRAAPPWGRSSPALGLSKGRNASHVIVTILSFLRKVWEKEGQNTCTNNILSLQNTHRSQKHSARRHRSDSIPQS